MEIYLVGGAVRDELLNLPVKERDWVVVGATPEAMTELGYRPVGKDFPVFLHPQTHEEYALARTERKSGRGYKGFQVHASPEVTLEEDLLRRDLTINAIAKDIQGNLIDPYGGQEDLRNGLLRHVSPAFAEDPVRILRLARFAARFHRWGFHVSHGTNALMRKMVQDNEVDFLVPERVWAEFHKALQTDRPSQFFKVLHSCGALAILFPELEVLHSANAVAHGKGSDEPEFYSGFNRAATLESMEVRFALLGRALQQSYGSATATQAIAQLCTQYKAPNEYRELALLTTRKGPDFDMALEKNPAELLALLEQSDAFRRPERFHQALLACKMGEDKAYPQADYLQECLETAAAVQAAPLVQQGLKGKEIGERLQCLRMDALKSIAQKQ